MSSLASWRSARGSSRQFARSNIRTLTKVELLRITTTDNDNDRHHVPPYRHHPRRRWLARPGHPPPPQRLQGPDPPGYRSVRQRRNTSMREGLWTDESNRHVHTGMAKNKRQPYSVSEKAGHQTSAESWGTGTWKQVTLAGDTLGAPLTDICRPRCGPYSPCLWRRNSPCWSGRLR